MEDSLKTEIIIKSVTKIAQQEGIPVFVVKKGDPDSGIILIKIDLRSEKVLLFHFCKLKLVFQNLKTFGF